MSDDLKKARKSLNEGRVDEALLYLWNALEPARLEGRRAVRDVAQLAVAAARRGDESQKAEAQRLLDSLSELSDDADAEAAETVTVQDAAPPAPSPEPGAETETAAGTEAESEPDPETPARRNLGRYAIPAIFILIVLVNVLARALGD